MSTVASPYLSFQEVGLTYAPQGEQPVLRGIDLDVHRGETVCLVGASGCGKSTLLNIAAGFLEPTEGRALVENRSIEGPGSDRVMVFQDDATFPWYTVRQNVEYGLRVQALTKKERVERAEAAIDLVGLSAFRDAYPKQLSGGMRKRCDMARAIAVRPTALLMDEPFAALDVLTKERLQVQYRDISATDGTTSLFVTHDLEEAIFVGDRIAILRRGAGPFLALVDVPFAHPREPAVKTSPEFQDLRRELTAYLDQAEEWAS